MGSETAKIYVDALHDFQEIHDYITKDNAARALDFILRLQQRCDDLTGFPGMGRKCDEIKLGYRSVAEGEYIIFYRMLGDDVLVISRVINAKRDLGKIVFKE